MNLPHDMGLPFQLPPGAVAGRPGKFISKTTAEKIGPHEKKRKQQVQKTSLRAGRLTLHTQRNQNEAKEPGSLLQGSVKRIELNAFTCMDRR